MTEDDGLPPRWREISISNSTVAVSVKSTFDCDDLKSLETQVLRLLKSLQEEKP